MLSCGTKQTSVCDSSMEASAAGADWCGQAYRIARLTITLMQIMTVVLLFLRVGTRVGVSESGVSCVLLAALFALQLPALLESVRTFFRCQLAKGVRSTSPVTLRSLLFQISTKAPSVAILAIFHGELWSSESIGICGAIPWWLSMSIGLLVAALMHQFKKMLLSPSTRPEKKQALSHEFLPENKYLQMAVAFELVLLSSVVEEVIHRGFFVFALGSLLGCPACGICLGLILCVATHLYLGIENSPNVILFFFVAVALLYSPAGLLAATSFHCMLNLLFLRNIKRDG